MTNNIANNKCLKYTDYTKKSWKMGRSNNQIDFQASGQLHNTPSESIRYKNFASWCAKSSAKAWWHFSIGWFWERWCRDLL